MSERPVPAPVAVKRCLLPDLDGELFARSEPLDELLLSLAEWADEEPDEVPAALHRPASDPSARCASP